MRVGTTWREAGRGLVLLVLALCSRAWAEDGGVEPVLRTASPIQWPEDAGPGGDVELLLTVDEQGSVTDVQVESTPSEAFSVAAIAAAKGLEFEPVVQDGGAVRFVIAYRYVFERVDAGPPTALLQGTVMTRGTREPIALAQVGLADGGLVVESDSEGRFSLELPAGPISVQVSASGHVARAFKENLSPGQRVEVVYRLERTYGRPYETVIRGQADRAEVSRVSLSGAELHEVAGTAGDPMRVVMLLPGVGTAVSGLSYPVVRGAVPAATGYFLDGVRVPQLYHLLALNPVVHPDFIESIDFFAANAPTRYGRVSGGVVSAQVAKARDDRVHFTVSPDLLQTNAFVEVPIASTGTNITVGGSVNYVAWVLAALAQARIFPANLQPVAESYDYQARIEQKVGKGTVRLLAFGSSDRAGVRPSNDNGYTLLATSRFHRVDLRGQFPLGPGDLELGSNVGWETLGGEFEQHRSGGKLQLDRFTWTGRASYRLQLGEHFQLKGGLDFELQESKVDVTLGLGEDADLLHQPHVPGFFTGTFVEAAFFSERWTVVAGARVDTWHLPPSLTLVSADPRLDVRFKPADTVTLRASAGLAHQAPMLLLSLPVSDTAALGTGLQEVGQFSLGGVVRLPWLGLEVSSEAFYNHIFQARERSIFEFVSGVSSLDSSFAGNRWGRAYGVELMLRLPQQGRLFGWLSYTLMRSERMRRFASYDETQTQTSTATAMLPFAFDQAHTLNVTLGYQFDKGYKIGATFHLNSGRPESGEFGSRTSRIVEDPATGYQQWLPVPLNEIDRLPPFARLDLRVSKTVTFSMLVAEVYLDVMNILVRPEVYGFSYGVSPEDPSVLEKQPLSVPLVLPTLGIKVIY